MKVLMTGVTARHCNSQKIDRSYAEATESLKLLLAVGGAEIHHRAVTWGEDLSGYDVILLGLTKMCSLAAQARHVLAASWIHKTAINKTALYYDDWAAIATVQNCQTMVRTFEKRIAFFRQSTEIDADQELDIYSMAEHIGARRPYHLALIPAFAWADRASLTTDFPAVRANILWDPTTFSNVFDFTADASETKEKRWISATLQDHDKWIAKLGCRWPVEEYGQNKRKGQPRLSETEIRALYRLSWGVLAPKYPMSGWWRARFYHAAEADSILLCDYADSRYMSKAHQLQRFDVEQANESKLRSMAIDQRHYIRENITPRNRTLDEVMSALRTISGGLR